jgi:hypothetical protein
MSPKAVEIDIVKREGGVEKSACFIESKRLCCINKLKLLKEKKLFDFQNPTNFNNYIGCNIYLICATKPIKTIFSIIFNILFFKGFYRPFELSDQQKPMFSLFEISNLKFQIMEKLKNPALN